MELISSIELIEITKISRATLNNYIKMNILPKPVIRKPSNPRVRAKRLGYFPDSALSTLEQIKSLKREGLSMKTILDRLGGTSSAPQSTAASRVRMSVQASLFEESLPEPAKRTPRSGSPSDPGKDIPDFRPFCVLAALLHDAERIQAELHAEEYFDLVRQLGESAGTAAESSRGLQGSHPWQDKMLFYFLKTADAPYLTNAVLCAMELREAMLKLSVEWKRRKGWFNELRLNVGISEGEDYLGFLPVPTGMCPAAFGGTVREAIGLAERARGGSIWTTKRVIQKMNRKDREKIPYGIRHIHQDREVFVRNSFARFRDVLSGDPSGSSRLVAMECLAVAEIADRI